MASNRMLGLALAVAALLGACRADTEESVPEGAAGTRMPMAEDAGMAGRAASGGMEDMAAHMSMMAAMTGDSLHDQLPMHRQNVANMIARMDRQRRDMDMVGDPAWNATIDSLREDLVHMPAMVPADLEAMMPDHLARARRLMEMHRQMMADRGM
jgi:hypothetical protein